LDAINKYLKKGAYYLVHISIIEASEKYKEVLSIWITVYPEEGILFPEDITCRDL
jgi:hypothetical protein